MLIAVIILGVLVVILAATLYSTWRFFHEYVKDWPNLKDDFDEHMIELYNIWNSKNT